MNSKLRRDVSYVSALWGKNDEALKRDGRLLADGFIVPGRGAGEKLPDPDPQSSEGAFNRSLPYVSLRCWRFEDVLLVRIAPRSQPLRLISYRKLI